MTLQDNIKEWIKIDNEITSLNSRVKELRDSKKPIQCSIVEHIETENLFDATVKISDGRLKFVQQRQAAQLTLKYVEQCLKEKIANEEKPPIPNDPSSSDGSLLDEPTDQQNQEYA